MAAKTFSSVDEYISSYPVDVQAKLKRFRNLVLDSAPGVTEKISYGIPYYNLNGRLLYFAAFKTHIGFYPMTSPIRHFKKELSNYETSKGTIRFPLDKPLPVPLIKKIIKFRVKENLDKLK